MTVLKYVLIVLGIIVALIVFSVLRSWFDQGVSGESTVIGDSFVMGEFGYGRGGRLTYAVIRTFPTNSTSAQRNNDPRYCEADQEVLVRGNDGKMIPVGKDGAVYFFEGDRLRTLKVDALESDVGLRGRTLDEVWAEFQRYEVRE